MSACPLSEVTGGKSVNPDVQSLVVVLNIVKRKLECVKGITLAYQIPLIYSQ